ncbi:MAG: biopolymer transporter ExbD [Deltaproteobacteria bacterium]|jgi:biopolymer transport protein ExbD|nr:biopolymer transporter ExbD [Deltaproteobacteria bacterium]
MDPDERDEWGDEEALSEINVTPFIDIMLVLLIVFMITAPLMLGGVHINLPKTGGDPMPRPKTPLIVSLDAENRVFVDKEEVAPANQTARFKELAQTSENGEVFVRGDGMVRYKEMMTLMATLGQAGFARVTLVTDIRAPANGVTDPSASGAASSTPASGAAANPTSATTAAPNPTPAPASPSQ